MLLLMTAMVLQLLTPTLLPLPIAIVVAVMRILHFSYAIATMRIQFCSQRLSRAWKKAGKNTQWEIITIIIYFPQRINLCCCAAVMQLGLQRWWHRMVVALFPYKLTLRPGFVSPLRCLTVFKNIWRVNDILCVFVTCCCSIICFVMLC